MKISFIGFGNMAQAIAKAFIAKSPISIKASAPDLTTTTLANGIYTSPNNLDVIKDADVVILAVKPDKMKQVLNEIQGFQACMMRWLRWMRL